MQVHVMLLVSCLVSTNYISSMDYKGPVEPQTQSALSAIPLDVVPKFLSMNTTWATVRSVLALQQTCRWWHSRLDQVQKKKLVCSWLKDGKELDEQNCLNLALQMVAPPPFNNPVEMFLLAGAQVNHTTSYGDSPLMFAVNTEKYSIPYIQILIKMEATINHQNNNGDTALHFAARNGFEHCVEVLLLYKADKTLENLKGKTPIQCIEQMVSEYGDFSRFSLPGQRELRNERIKALLDGTMTPKESIADPIVEDVKPSAKDALDALLDSDSEQPINEDFFA